MLVCAAVCVLVFFVMCFVVLCFFCFKNFFCNFFVEVSLESKFLYMVRFLFIFLKDNSSVCASVSSVFGFVVLASFNILKILIVMYLVYMSLFFVFFVVIVVKIGFVFRLFMLLVDVANASSVFAFARVFVAFFSRAFKNALKILIFFVLFGNFL